MFPWCSGTRADMCYESPSQGVGFAGPERALARTSAPTSCPSSPGTAAPAHASYPESRV